MWTQRWRRPVCDACAGPVAVALGAQHWRGVAVDVAWLDLGLPKNYLATVATELSVLPELLGLRDGINTSPRRNKGSRASGLAVAPV